ncbi:phytanoyl-CoA dioxygenase [Hyaloraphidium curvatum]|nr:phytanoyl-CoA dioxygenase [Hyaloraphidium curvatum]
MATGAVIPPALLSQLAGQYAADGFCIARGLFSPAEAASLRDHFTSAVETGDASAEEKPDPSHPDPLKRYPRLLQPHRRDPVAMDFMLDARLRTCLVAILGAEPLAVQTMAYFKPPGARGQALHQDNRYLRADPGTCHGVWLALDSCDAGNGAMAVVPGSHALPVLCPGPSDAEESWTKDTLKVPDGMEAIVLDMAPGDVLLFHGNLIHGSYRNATADRFRRCLIAHYVEGDAEIVAKYYHPAYRFDGTVAGIGGVEYGGGKCGVMLEDGTIEMSGEFREHGAAH